EAFVPGQGHRLGPRRGPQPGREVLRPDPLNPDDGLATARSGETKVAQLVVRPKGLIRVRGWRLFEQLQRVRRLPGAFVEKAIAAVPAADFLQFPSIIGPIDRRRAVPRRPSAVQVVAVLPAGKREGVPAAGGRLPEKHRGPGTATHARRRVGGAGEET